MKEANGTKLYDVDELSAMLGVHRLNIYKAIREQKLRAVRLGRRLYATEEALRDYLNGRK